MATQKEIKELANEIGKYLAVGVSLHAAAKQLNVSYRQALCAKKHLAESIMADEGGTMWLTFHLQMHRQYQELLELKKRAKDRNNLNAEIGAQKLIMDLTAKQIDFAQKLGLVHTEPLKVDVNLETMAASWEKLFNFKGIVNAPVLVNRN